MTDKQTLGNGLIPAKPYYAIYKNAGNALLYDDAPKRFMYIDTCETCRHKLEGAENGGRIDLAEATQENIWYYCTHPDFTGWPKRIGQIEKTKEIPSFCPLESLVYVNDSIIKITADEDKGKKERAKKVAVTKNDTVEQSEVPKDIPVIQPLTEPKTE